VVADGEQGVLWVRTPSVAMGYYKRLDQSRRTFVGAWLRTGDVYRRDETASTSTWAARTITSRSPASG
jgi:long-subunit acyl-CoA synthetase (AMP-forming)